MKKYEILYNWPISEIERLADSKVAEDYANSLDDTTSSQFVTLTERMRTLGAELAVAKAARNHFAKWPDLHSCVLEFGKSFESFPKPSVEKLKFSILLIRKLSQSLPQLNTGDIDVNAFELRELTHQVPLKWFSRENSQSIENSVVIFSRDDYDEVEREITSAIISPDLLFQLIAALHNTSILPSSQAILVKNMNPPIEPSAVSAFARLAVLSTGKPVHSARKYVSKPSVLIPDDIQPCEPYQQWNEVLNVLSEYNSRDEILLKFLTIYHVIENFMFKRPIVELERQKNGGMFSIRDFRRLYDGVDIGEPEALKRLFKSVFEMYAKPSVKFGKHVAKQWLKLAPKKAEINSAIKTLGLNLEFNAFNETQAAPFFSKLVYSVRNAIVHNKETEFHLTYASLDTNPGLYTLIENFLLPSLEEISFSLIAKSNNEFWYQNREIQLYI